MSFINCIDRALTAKRITGKKADEARERYANLYGNAVRDGMSPTDAEDFAAENATKQIEAEKAMAKQRQFKQMAWTIDDRALWQAGGAAKIGINAKAVIEGQIGSTPRVSLNDHVTTAEGRIKTFLADMIDKYSPKAVGLHYPKAGLENIVRELFTPGSTGDTAAAGYATAWTKATDLGVKMFRDAGGILNSLAEWRLPQHQSRIKLYRIGEAAWTADHMQWLDWDKMQWPNGARIDPADRARVLSEVYKTMKTGGDVNIQPGQYRGAGSSGIISDHRFLIYKDAESWLSAHGKYGDGNVYETMMNHVEAMARQIGIVKTFGPNPTIGLHQMIANMRAVAGAADAAATEPPRNALGFPTTYHDEATAAEHYLTDAFQVKVAGASAPENGSRAIVAGLLGDARNLIMSATLGSVYLYQGTQDFFTAALRYRLAGLPVMRSVGTYLKMFSTADREMPKVLARAGFINLAQSRMAQSMTRLTGLEPHGSRLTQRLSDTIMRASLTEWHAAAARFTTAAEFCGALADWRGMSFDEIPGKAMFEAHGITAADWDKMRAVPVHDVNGHAFIFPDDHIFKTANGSEAERYDIADKFMAMINQEAKLATIETQVAAQLTLKGTTRAGTLVGEIARSAAMFKNFPLTILNTHIRQGLIMPTIPGKIGYISQVMLGLTMFGAVGVVLHDVAAGKNPQSFREAHFWTRAFLAGGGAGIVGDYLAGNLEFDEPLGKTVAGPMFAEASDLIDMAEEAAKAVAGEPHTHFARKANAFAARYFPGDTLWYLRAPLRGMIWDQLLKATDPQSAEVFRRRARFAKQNGQDYWYPPGSARPTGAPDFGALARR